MLVLESNPIVSIKIKKGFFFPSHVNPTLPPYSVFISPGVTDSLHRFAYRTSFPSCHLSIMCEAHLQTHQWGIDSALGTHL